MKKIKELYKAAKELADSCGDNYGSESADNGFYEKFYSEEALDKLNQILRRYKDVME